MINFSKILSLFDSIKFHVKYILTIRFSNARNPSRLSRGIKSVKKLANHDIYPTTFINRGMVSSEIILIPSRTSNYPDNCEPVQ